MIDIEKTKEQLLDELAQLRQQVQELEQREEQHKQRERAIHQQLIQEQIARSQVEQSSQAVVSEQNALQDRQHFLEKLTEMSPGLLYLFDVIEQRNIYINARSLDTLGYTPETVPMMDANSMSQWMHPDDLAQMPAYLEQLATATDGTFLEREYRIRHANGEWHWFSSRDTVFSRTADGRVCQILGTAQDITKRKQAEHYCNIQYAITRVLAEATCLSDAFPAILQAFCENLGWQFGVIWRVNHQSRCLHYVDGWQAPATSAQGLMEVNLQTTFAPGVGLPGRVWKNGQPLWISNLDRDSNFPRATEAVQAGLQTVFGFPILLGNHVLGVIECFCDRIQEPDEDLLNMMAAIGSQIGQFMERKRAEASLQESHELFQSFMNHSPIAAFIKDEAGRYLYANPWVERVYQRSQADLLGKTDFELMPPAIAEQFHQNDIAVLTSGQPMQVLETIHQEDGEHSYMSFKFPFRNAVGQQALAGVAIDVSERVQAAAALQQREAELRLITNAVPVLISFIDVEQRYRFTNQMYEAWFGRPASQVEGKHLWEVIGEAGYEAIRPYVERVLDGHQVTFESEIPYKDIDTRIVSATYVPRFAPEGRVEGFVALVSDITQRKQAEQTLQQSEERLRVAQQAANAGVWDWDITTNQVTWSEEYYRLYGLGSAITQSSYENWLNLVVEQDRDRFNRAAREALQHQIDLSVEFRILHPIQGERWLTAIGQTFYDNHEQPIRMIGIALDITERKQAEQALRESEEWARLAIQVGRLGGWRLHLETNLVEMDQRMRDIWGEPEDAVMVPLPRVIDRMHPDDQARVVNAVTAAIDPQSTGTYEIEYRIVWDDGSERWVLAKGQAQFEGEGEFRRTVDFFGTLLDITDRKQVEAALAESNQTLQAIIQACPLAIMGLRSDGTVQIWNPAAERILGWSQQEVLGQFLPAIPDDRRDEFLNNLATTLHGQGLAGVETQRQKKGNVLFDVELWTAPVDEAQAGISCLSVVADITARKRTEAALRLSEERLHSFVIANIIGILFGDLEGGIQEANDELLRIVGYSREDLQAGNLRWIDITPPEYLPLDEKAIDEAQQRGACSPYEKEYIRKDGSRVPVLVGFSLMLADREETVAFVLDLSDRKQAEVEREQLLRREQTAREQAEAANRIKDEFLAVLSHELRTPLNPILGWTKLLRTRQFDAAATDRALDTIERNAKLQAQLIEDLLDVSRILQGKVKLAACPVNLVTTIEAALETVRLSAEAKGIQIQTGLDSKSALVNGDANRLQQIVWNLLSNAIKFTPSGGRVEVRLEQTHGYAQIQVSDTGQGISPDFLPYVFEYFRQADSSTTRQFGGLGLGLAIVRHLVELHGGTVEAESPGHGMGATFTVQLPLMVSVLTPHLEALPIQETSNLNNISILIVDDEADMRDLVQVILEGQGATVRVAASGAEALQQFTESVPDILISDIGMPEMDGYTLMQQIRATLAGQGKVIPAIALTAYAGEVNQQKALQAGFQHHLAKPIEPDLLVHTVTVVLKNHNCR
ncbi:MAG TPA: PAS domain S-box protein [Trichocoleus sp.]|jgi:PAS domain S-box-containing protein